MDSRIRDILPSDIADDETVYIVSADLGILYVNDQWRKFAQQNNGGRVLEAAWNPRVLENLAGTEQEKWRHLYRLLLEGRMPMYREEFNASGPNDRLRFELRVTPRRDDQGKICWLVHRTIPIETEARATTSRTLQQERLKRSAIDSPDEVTRSYRERVLHRAVHFPAFHTARHLQPLDDVGGDILWSCERPDGMAYLMHGDAMGHGIEAARIAARVVECLDEIALEETDLARIAERVNRLLLDQVAGDDIAFVTGLLFQCQRDPKRLKAVNFGHHGPIFSRRGAVSISSGLPLGIDEAHIPWPVTAIDLEQYGHRFLIFSDGVLEQFAPNGEPYGTDRLCRAFVAHLDDSLDEMLREILQDLSRYRGGAIVKDDQTVLALELIENTATMAA